jgi:hypothetical protein
MIMGLLVLVLALGAIGWASRFGADTRGSGRAGWLFR